MKYLAFLLYFVIPTMGFSQQPVNNADKLLKITKNGITEEVAVDFDEHLQYLTIGDMVIPISEHTTVKRRKHNGNHVVEFSLQEATAITSKIDPDFRRAWFLLEFKSKKQAKNFVKLFKKVIQEKELLGVYR